jgi:hypothetical protein
MNKKDGRKPRYRAGFSLIVMFLVLIFIGPMVYLGCGSTEPQTGEPQKSGPSATGEPGTIITRGGRPKTTPANQAEVIERFVKNMQLGNIAFNAPSTINLQEHAVIQLILSLKKSIDDLKKMIEAEGEKQGASIRVSNMMVAQLRGTNFQINAVTPETQVVTSHEATEWKWEVKPTSAGRQKLFLTLSAPFTVDGQSTSKLIRSYDKTIEVNVTLGQRATDFIDKYWQWLWAAVILPLAGWLWKRRQAAQAQKSPETKE